MGNRGNSQRRRGRRAEYKVRDLFRTLGWKAERVPISGAGSIKGDVIARKGNVKVVAEVKRLKYLPAVFFNRITAWRDGQWDIVLDMDGNYWLVADAYTWISNMPAIRGEVQLQAQAKRHTVVVKNMPRIILRMMEQAERENATLFIVPERIRHYIVVERIVV